MFDQNGKISRSKITYSGKNKYSGNYLSTPKSMDTASKSSSTISSRSSKSSTTARFINNPRPTIFKSVLSKGPRNCHNKFESFSFAYDLSPEERHFGVHIAHAMKDVPHNERKLLQNGHQAYLTRRYEHAPDYKYNYPEATSWRIGWLHNQLLQKN